MLQEWLIKVGRWIRRRRIAQLRNFYAFAVSIGDRKLAGDLLERIRCLEKEKFP